MDREDREHPGGPEKADEKTPEKDDLRRFNAEDALGDRLADIVSDVENAGAAGPLLDDLETAASGIMPVPDEVKEEARTIDSAIASLKAGMKRVLMSVEGALKGRRSFEYEYRDARGRLLCRAKAEMGTAKKRVPLGTVDGREGRARILHSLVLEGEKDGRSVSVDVLRLANAHGDPVLVGTERLENSAYDTEGRNVIVSSLETPLDLATLLHELGHSDQSREPRFVASGITDIRQPEATKPNAADLPAEEIEELLRKVSSAIPEIEQVIDRQALAEIRSLEEEMAGIVLDSPENARRVDDLYGKKKSLIEDALRLEDMVLLPKRMLERDATRRAFVWLRELRGMGIDLLGALPSPAHEVPSESKASPQGCEQAMETAISEGGGRGDGPVETTIREELDRSLKTYKAERTRFKKPGGSGPGIRPSAGSRRKIT